MLNILRKKCRWYNCWLEILGASRVKLEPGFHPQRTRKHQKRYKARSRLVGGRMNEPGNLDISCCCSVTKSCLTLWDPMDCSTPGFPVLPYLPEFAQIHVHWVVTPSNHLILSRPLLLMSSIFPSIRVFSSELSLHIQWPKYSSFGFSISPFHEYSGLISFRNDWFDHIYE